ncbi:HlyD family secretion protein [uncultured Pseudodesulfovibrio sp.]|uniref:HlyD family secretion protein n=1 Tax=uncultured Pseudodesulfovibrio sp. TaxID=2035858 RepID=UPI0029C833E4|nr:HlyD family secretion protein [uncultured Pseudodesulfovibrio sp.]
MNWIRKNTGRILVTLAMLVCAAWLGRHMWEFYKEAPWTRDGRISADIVQITPDVSGIVADVMVKDNQIVHKGDVLFHIDPKRYTLALQQAKTEVASTRATLAMTKNDLGRYTSLATNRVVSPQRLQEAQTDQQQAISAYNNAVAKLKIAELNLSRATVRASVDGMLTNFSLRPGNYAHAGEAVAALVDAKSYYVVGYFEETKLRRIRPDASVRIDVMGESEPIYGHVDSIAGGIQDQDNNNSGLLASVSPTFSWVRLAQRIPVRVTIDENPNNIQLIVGRTATVTVIKDNKAG